MLNAKARWELSDLHEPDAVRLAQELKLHPLIGRLLASRGFVKAEQARSFMLAGVDQLHDPYLMKGMEQAVARIRQALDRKQKIRIYGDYDADGISATTLMIYLMRHLGADYDTYIPHRIQEGYGLNKPALQQASTSEIELIITVDTGISSYHEVAYARELGIDIIVTDHHQPPEQLPDAASVVNPRQPGCPYPFKELAGVGVAFKLAQAILGAPPLEWLGFAAIGTVADLMPLLDENRVIVKLGLETLRSTSNPGIQALVKVSGIDQSAINETDIAFAMAPRINASGRMDHADTAVQLFTVAHSEQAEQLASTLDSLNRKRQSVVDQITQEALMQITQRELEKKPVIVVCGTDWNVGVVGIVASKLLEKFNRPALVLSIDAEGVTAKGSGRSIAAFDLHRALTESQHLLQHYGGHQAAAGLTLEVKNLPELERSLEQLALSWLSEEDFIPVFQADLACSLTDAPLPCIDQLSKLAPFGSGNPAPRFLFEGLSIREKRTIGREQQHLKLLLEEVQGEIACSMEAIGFGKGSAAEQIASTSQLDILGELSINEWNGRRKPQILIRDIRVRQLQVFDWRGAKNQWTNKAISLPDECGILVFDPDMIDRLPDGWLQQIPVWNGATDVPEAVNGIADKTAISAVESLMLYDLPGSREQLARGLRSFSGALRLYAIFTDVHLPSPGLLPGREAFKSIYGLLQQEGTLRTDDQRIWPALQKRFAISKEAACFILGVFEEVGLVDKSGSVYALVANPAKKDLTESALYRKWQNREHIEQLLVYSSSAELTGLLLNLMNC